MELTPREKDKLLLFTAALLAARLAAFGQQRSGEEEQLVLLAGSQFHGVFTSPRFAAALPRDPQLPAADAARFL